MCTYGARHTDPELLDHRLGAAFNSRLPYLLVELKKSSMAVLWKKIACICQKINNTQGAQCSQDSRTPSKIPYVPTLYKQSDHLKCMCHVSIDHVMRQR